MYDLDTIKKINAKKSVSVLALRNLLVLYDRNLAELRPEISAGARLAAAIEKLVSA